MEDLNVEEKQVSDLLKTAEDFKTTLAHNITFDKVIKLTEFSFNSVDFLKHSSNLDGIKNGGLCLFCDFRNFVINVLDFNRILHKEKPYKRYTDARDDVNYNKWLAKGNKQQFIKNETHYYLRFLKQFVINDLKDIQSEILYKLNPKEHNINYKHLTKIYKNWSKLDGGHMFKQTPKRMRFEVKAMRKDMKNGKGSGISGLVF